MMEHPKKDFLTTKQVAERWELSELDVHQLLLTRSLPQTFLVFGKATLVRGSASVERHPFTATASAITWILVSARQPSSNLYTWPLSSVNRVYDFVVDGVSDPTVLETLCLLEVNQPTGWTIEFEAEGTQIIGQNRIRKIADVLQDTALVLTDAVLAFEEQLSILPAVKAQEQAVVRDTRKPRCRAIAQILWERDPRATIPDIFQSEWVRRIACENRPPSEKTFREWIKDLNPDRSPGRRPA